MATNTATKVFLVICALVFLPYGIMCFLDPGLLSDAAGVEANSTTGSTELRAMYGGLQASVGVLAIIALIRTSLTSAFLVMLATLTAGLLSARLAGLVMDGGFTGYTGMALGFETVLMGCSLFFLKGQGTTDNPQLNG